MPETTLAFSIPCSIATLADQFGRLLAAPAVILIIGFPLVVIFGPGRGYLSSVASAIGIYFGNRRRALIVGILLLAGAVGAGLIAMSETYGSGCAF